jgi:hypothetical protein
LEILLSGPPSLAFMVFEPGIQVNPVKDAAPTDPHVRHVELRQEGDADAQVDRCLLPGQAAHGRQGQAGLIHHRNPCLPL